MESSQAESTLFELQYDEELKISMRGAANWAGFAALASFISTILEIVSFFIQRARIQSLYKEYGVNNEPAMFSDLIYALISFVLGVLLFVFLMKFGQKTKAGLDADENDRLNEGFSGLAVYFRIIGIVLIIAIILLLLALLTLIGQV